MRDRQPGGPAQACCRLLLVAVSQRTPYPEVGGNRGGRPATEHDFSGHP